MFDNFTPFSIQTQSEPPVTIAGVQSPASPNLPPLLLLHGFPQTHHIWHLVAPQLLKTYNVVIPDIRGYGESSKPPGVESYAKSAMARDCIALMDQLGYKDQSFYVCAHDRGARIAHKLCVDHPHRVKKTILLDICPTLAMYNYTNFQFAKAYFHWFFLIQAAPLPETAIVNSAEQFTKMYMGARQGDSVSIFDKRCYDAYEKCLSDMDTVHGMCNDYRASASLDMEEQKSDLENARLIQCPLLVLWGKKGVIEKCFDAVKEWQAVTDPKITVQGYAVDSGHYIPEEVPDATTEAILSFLKD